MIIFRGKCERVNKSGSNVEESKKHILNIKECKIAESDYFNDKVDEIRACKEYLKDNKTKNHKFGIQETKQNSKINSKLMDYRKGSAISTNKKNPNEKSFYLNKKVILYKTEMCRSFLEVGSCRYGDKCQFVHDGNEIRSIQRHPKYKTEICKTFWNDGNCPYGGRCCFVHLENLENDKKLVKDKFDEIPTNPIENKIDLKDEVEIDLSNGIKFINATTEITEIFEKMKLKESDQINDRVINELIESRSGEFHFIDTITTIDLEATYFQDYAGQSDDGSLWRSN